MLSKIQLILYFIEFFEHSKRAFVIMKLNFEKELGKNLKIGMLFPGQGSQFHGMGKEFYDNERIFQELFENAHNALKENFVKLCFSSSDKILQGTIITQTGVFLVSAATYVMLAKNYGLVPDLLAGHSLGEYTAVFAGDGLNFFDSLYLLHKRAQFMSSAMEEQNGGLLAVLNLDYEILRSICDRYDKSDSQDQVAEIAIFNSPTQTVVSGTLPELQQIAEEVEIMRGKAIFLPVTGAFHSRLLREAEKKYSAYLVKVDFHPLKIPLISNVLAKEVMSPEEIKLSLIKQTSSHIYWWKSMQHFKEMDLIVEVGPNNKLSKMLMREWKDKPIVSINNYADITTLKEVIASLESKK